MPADLVTGKTFAELQLDFAIQTSLCSYANGGRGAPQLPRSEHDLFLCKHWVNKGYQRFMRSDPEWTFSKFRLELTMDPTGLGPMNVAKDGARYRLPSFLRGNPRGNFRYNDLRTTYTEVVVIDPASLQRMRQRFKISSVPVHACTRPIDPADKAEARGWEVVFYPPPNTAYVVEADWRIEPYDLRDPDEKHVAGGVHDHAIIASALDLWARSDTDNPRAGESRVQDWADALASSLKLDRALRTKNRGQLRNTTVPYTNDSFRLRSLVTKLDGRVIP